MRIIIAILSILLTPSVSLAQAEVRCVVESFSGGYQYNYEVENVGHNQIYSFSLDDVTSITSIVSPMGWEGFIFSTGVQWVATDDGINIPNYIQSGQSLSGFSITSSSQPTNSIFTIADIPDFNTFSGITIGPGMIAASAAEPNTTYLFASILLLLIAYLIYYRLKQYRRPRCSSS